MIFDLVKYSMNGFDTIVKLINYSFLLLFFFLLEKLINYGYSKVRVVLICVLFVLVTLVLEVISEEMTLELLGFIRLF